MKNNLIRYGLPCGLLLCFNVCFGQSDSTRYPAPALAAISTFNKAIGLRSWLYSGADYKPGRQTKGNPHFNDSTHTVTGSITYYGFNYPNVPVLYNIYDDQVVTTWIDGTSLISLSTDRVSDFTLPGHHFIRLTPDEAASRTVKPGFYDELYKGKIQALGRYVKTIHIVNTFASPDDYYETKNYYYLKKDGRYYAVTSQSDILDALKDHQDELKQYIKQEHIDFRRNPQQAMISLSTYYDHLTN